MMSQQGGQNLLVHMEGKTRVLGMTKGVVSLLQIGLRPKIYQIAPWKHLQFKPKPARYGSASQGGKED